MGRRGLDFTNKRVIQTVPTGLMVPCVGTLAWTGTVQGKELRYEQQRGVSGRRRILLDRIGDSYYMDMEEHLPGVITRRVLVEYEPGALKAQVVIARTCIRRQMEGAGDEEGIAESALDMDYPEVDQLKKLWGLSRFPEYYRKLEDAVKAASGVVMTYERKCVDLMYCRATTDMARQGDFTHPYLQITDCPGGVETKGHMQILSFSRESFVSDTSSIPVGESGPRTVEVSQVPGAIQIVSGDDAGCVDTVQTGSADYIGEEVQYALNLASSCFMLKSCEDEIRAMVKGTGHGYGLSQVTANGKAKEGWKAEGILGYSYKNIAFISE